MRFAVSIIFEDRKTGNLFDSASVSFETWAKATAFRQRIVKAVHFASNRSTLVWGIRVDDTLTDKAYAYPIPTAIRLTL